MTSGLNQRTAGAVSHTGAWTFRELYELVRFIDELDPQVAGPIPPCICRLADQIDECVIGVSFAALESTATPQADIDDQVAETLDEMIRRLGWLQRALQSRQQAHVIRQLVRLAERDLVAVFGAEGEVKPPELAMLLSAMGEALDDLDPYTIKTTFQYEEMAKQIGQHIYALS
jgi:hypothetical protein